MPENYDQGEEIIVGNKRLRKVKRPKQHAAPITVENSQSAYVPETPQNTQFYPQETPQNTDFYSQEAPTYEALVSQEYEQSTPPSQYVSQQQSYIQEEQANPNVPQFYEPQINNQNSYHPQEGYLQDNTYAENQSFQNITSSYLYGSIEKKKVLWIGVICLFVGIFIGALFFGGHDQVVQNGLQGVVINPEVPKGRARCGVSEKMQGCVLYVMNPQRQELNGRDFYDLASQLTGRQRFVIETGNMRYSSVKIKPGAIAQLNIPPLQ